MCHSHCRYAAPGCIGPTHAPPSTSLFYAWLVFGAYVVSWSMTLLAPGLLALLDQECMVPKGSDDAYARKLYSTSTVKGHPRFAASSRNQVCASL